jgi:hypothetical protein
MNVREDFYAPTTDGLHSVKRLVEAATSVTIRGTSIRFIERGLIDKVDLATKIISNTLTISL